MPYWYQALYSATSILAYFLIADAFVVRPSHSIEHPVLLSNTELFSTNNNHRRRQSMRDILKDHETYGWEPNPDLSADENLMDLCMIVTRSSKLKQGSMACILVREDTKVESLADSILAISNNRPLFSKKDSDIHAEIAALGDACRRGTPTENATAYITMPPCTRCFAALTASGIKRIVTRYGPPQKIQDAAARNNMEWVAISNHKEMMMRVNALCNGTGDKKRTRDETGEDASSKENTTAKKNQSESE